MKPSKQLLARLGYEADQKLLILHFDDLGMCQATIDSFNELLDFGLVSSASVISVSPWFEEVARQFGQHCDFDFGVHQTLTCEWDRYKWKPELLSSQAIEEGLVNDQKYFHQNELALQQLASVAVVKKEMKLQIEKCLDAGLSLSHVDSHMFATLNPRFCQVYCQQALEFGLLPMMFDQDFLTSHDRGDLIAGHDLMCQRQAPLIQHVAHMSYSDSENRLEQAKAVVDALKPGVTHFMFHPAVDSKELRALSSDWRIRVADHKVLLSKNFKQYLKENNVVVIDYKPLQSLIPVL